MAEENTKPETEEEATPTEEEATPTEEEAAPAEEEAAPTEEEAAPTEEEAAPAEEEAAPTEEETFGDIANEAGLSDELNEASSDKEDTSEAKPEDGQQEDEAKAEAESKPKPIPQPKPRRNPNKIDLARDLQDIPRNPLWIIITVLAFLVLTLFVLLFIELIDKEKHKELKGYVSIYHKVPEWHHGELPEDVQEILDNYHEKRHKEVESMLLEKPDPRDQDPIMGDFYPEALSNEDVILILEEQNIGPITRSGATRTELMNLSGLNLTKISYKYLNNFVKSNLRYTDFTGINVDRLVFRGASMQFSQFVDAITIQADFTRSRLNYSNFYGAVVDGSLFTGAIAQKGQFTDARFKNCNFDESLFKLSDFSNSNLAGSSIQYAYLEGANFKNANLEGVNFKNSNLKSVSFVGANLRNVNFTNANLEGANLTGADIKGAIFDNADVAATNFKKVQNATKKQLQASKFIVSAYNIPKGVFPEKESWRERFKPPHEVYE